VAKRPNSEIIKLSGMRRRTIRNKKGAGGTSKVYDEKAVAFKKVKWKPVATRERGGYSKEICWGCPPPGGGIRKPVSCGRPLKQSWKNLHRINSKEKRKLQSPGRINGGKGNS